MKSEFRRFFLNLRKEIDIDTINHKADIIFNRLIGSKYYKNSQTIFVYIARDKEIPTNKIIKKALSDGKDVYVPKIMGKTMVAARLYDKSDLIGGSFNIPTSKHDEFIENPDLTICPGLSFDYEKNRLGYGAGFYDRFLDGRQTIKIGLVATDFLSLKLPSEDLDVKMDYIITEKEIF
ncbi:5-formyltetrahydrofolate cyclo-ligase [uncultured Anaerococcus sp.]|uniref:5-formyltetrahydrofolate cyclo-ligase n=1 Tax=uncultured Anaerococcus sp. TaxID=293428 RepID=UPI0025CBEB79|nr:5-formyltetrahydrofolate cyclo-ligase [uncultured Anaerococcus sp.]